MSGIVEQIDYWWRRLYSEKPLSGRETVQLQNFLAWLKTNINEGKANEPSPRKIRD